MCLKTLPGLVLILTVLMNDHALADKNNTMDPLNSYVPPRLFGEAEIKTPPLPMPRPERFKASSDYVERLLERDSNNPAIRRNSDDRLKPVEIDARRILDFLEE